MDDAPNVFISWSGPRSNHAAKALRKYLCKFIQRAEPWMSEKDIESGSVSLDGILTALEGTKVGIVCLTPENLNERWINFEAGPLLRTLDAKARVCTYLLAGLEPRSLKNPLAMFHATKAEKEPTGKLIHHINKNVDGKRLSEAELNATFAKWWALTTRPIWPS
jgi:TIR domain-containing protein